MVDWTYLPQHGDRFWYKFLRAGGGVRWYPRRLPSTFGVDVAGRLHVFTEVVGNAAWLGDTPFGDVQAHDVRAGVGFSTGGIYRRSR